MASARLKKFIACLLLLALLTPVWGGAPAAGALLDPPVPEVKIPVIATGADCTALLLDAETGEQLDSLSLEMDEEGYFVLTDVPLGHYAYKVKLKERTGTDTPTYDETVYQVFVDVFRTTDGEGNEKISAVVSARINSDDDPQALGGGAPKPANIKFANIPAPCKVDPPVQKILTGKPKNPATFTFIMEAADPAYPMPEGSVNGKKTVTITGAGEEDFGWIRYAEPGNYAYVIYEQNDALEGYTYDTTIYTMHMEVVNEGGQLVCYTTVYKNDVLVDGVKAVFTNKYSTKPKTGDEANPILWLGLAAASLAAVFILLLVLRKRKKK